MAYSTKEKEREYNRQYYQSHKEKVKADALAWGRSEKGKAYFKEYFQKNKKHHQLLQHKYHEKLKQTVLAHYSNNKIMCMKCKENRINCLSIDHINGGGVKHRVDTGQGNNFYLWLKRNSYPSGYQVLCMNCQFIKRYENNEFKN